MKKERPDRNKTVCVLTHHAVCNSELSAKDVINCVPYANDLHLNTKTHTHGARDPGPGEDPSSRSRRRGNENCVTLCKPLTKPD